MRAFWHEFRRGAFGTTRGSLVGILAVAALWFLLASILVTPRFMASHASPCTEHAEHGARATGRALALRHAEARPLTVLLIGASGFRMALTPPGEVEALVAGKLGRSVEVVDLTVGGLTVWESTALLDQVPDGFCGLVVHAVGPGLLAYEAKDLANREEAVRFGFDSPARDDELRRAGYEPRDRTGVYFLDHLPFLVSLRREWPCLVRGETDSPPQRCKPWRQPMEGDELEARCAMVRERLSDYSWSRDPCLSVFDRSVARVRARGRLEVVLVDSPRNPRLEGRAQPRAVIDDYLTIMRRFAAERSLTFLEPNAAGLLHVGDFVDECHIQEIDAARRYTTWLADRIVPLLREMIDEETRR